MNKKIITFFTLSLITVLLIPVNSLARIYFFDRKIEITGKIEQKIGLKYHMKEWEKGRDQYRPNTRGGRMKNPATFKPHFHIDALCHLYRGEDTILDFYTLWEWFYDFTPDIRGDMHRAMATRDRNRYQTPHGLEMAREFYLNFVSGPWTLRLGKQMVVWGETSLQRTADVVNPLDMRSHMMGIDDWEDFKKGLWMFRGFYSPNFAPDYTFEWIWVPNDPKVMNLPPEGSLFNTSYTGGFFSEMQRRWKYDERNRHGLHDSQGGFRIRGFTWDWDWTLIYYNGIDPGPTCVDWGQRGSRSYKPTTRHGFSFYQTGVGGFNLWAAEYNVAVATGRPLPKFPTNRCFRYYRTDNFGATASKYFDSVDLFGRKFYTKANVRIEFSFREGQHFNKQTPMEAQGELSAWAVSGITKRDIIGYAFEISRYFWPKWLMRLNDQRKLETSFGLYQDWILNHDNNLDVSGFQPRGHGDRSSTTIQLTLVTDWFKQELDTRCTYAYSFSGSGYFWMQIMYAPGDHWRFIFLPNIRWSNAGAFSKKANWRGAGYTERNDSAYNNIFFKIAYQF